MHPSKRITAIAVITAIFAQQIQELLDGLAVAASGAVFTPDDAGYDDARTIFNSMVDKRPAYIAQCANAGDVVSALAFARRQGLPTSVRSGGHSVAGNCLVDGGLVVDMRNLNAVSVDPDARTAIVGGGATWSHFDRAAGPYGLATTGGRVSTTGVAGLTLGGGSGWFERKFGLACDNLISVDLVTADGRQVTASEKENAELFWRCTGRRQLRDRDGLRVSPPSVADHDARAAALPAGPRARGGASLPGSSLRKRPMRSAAACCTSRARQRSSSRCTCRGNWWWAWE